jgi:hypothetical protein
MTEPAQGKPGSLVDDPAPVAGPRSGRVPVVATVTGLLALLLAVGLPHGGIIGLLLSLVAVVCGFLGLRQGRATKHTIMSVVGIVSGGLALLVVATITLILVVQIEV